MEKEMISMKKQQYKSNLETISLYDDNNTEKNDSNIDKMETKLLDEPKTKKEKQEEKELDYVFKVIFVGDTNTGKTTICNTLMNRNIKTMQYQPTIGIDFNSLVKTIYNDINVKVQMWDTAGQEKYRSIITSYFRNISSAIITYDVTNKTSFMRVINWINELDRFNSCNHDYKHPILLLATKSDLHKERKVSFDEGFNMASKYSLIFREINSFELKGPLESGFKELLESIFLIVDNEKRENIKKIPVADPYPSYSENLTINLQPESTLAMANLESELISCKGVKCIENINNKRDRVKPTEESPKVCSKCVIC